MLDDDRLSVAVKLTKLNALSNASAQRKYEAELLAALDKIRKDFECGVRTTAAISQVTTKILDNDDDEAWNDITAEIVREGINAACVTANRNIIREWIDRVEVVLEDVEEEDGYGKNENSPPWPPSATPPEEALAVMTLDPSQDAAAAAPWLQKGKEPQVTAEVPSRKLSFSSHRSKNSKALYRRTGWPRFLA